MASIPSALETSFDRDVTLSGSQNEQSERLRSRADKRDEARSDRVENETRSEPEAAPQVAAPPSRAVTFRLNRETERFYIEVVDRSSGEVVRQIPPDQLLELAEQVGNLLNVSA